MCEQIFHILGSNWITSPVPDESSDNARCRTRFMSLLSLVFGLVATGALAIAVAVDHWLITHEPFAMKLSENANDTMCFWHFNAGLWHGCYYYEGRKYITSHHVITSHDITSHHITSHHIVSPYIVSSQHISSHHITSYHITSHHITSHHLTSDHFISHLITSV